MSLDIETVCNVQGCKGFGDYKKCDDDAKHALDPWRNRITKIGVYDGTTVNIFEDVAGFNHWVSTLTMYPDYVGQNFKFDLLNLLVRNARISIDQWKHDTQLEAYVLTEKASSTFVDQLKQRRKAAGVWKWDKIGQHALETLAAWFLDADPSWKWGDDKSNDEYLSKDLRYTYDLHFLLETKLKERGEWDFYHNRQLPYAKMLLEAEIRGAELDMPGLESMERELEQRREQLKLKLEDQWAEANEAYRRECESNLRLKYEEMATKRGKSLSTSAQHQKLYANQIPNLPTKLNLDSPKQRLWLFKEYLGLDCAKVEVKFNEFTDRYEEIIKESTDAEVIEKLINQGHTELQPFADWSEVNKLLTTFLPSFRELQADGVIHFIYNPDVTKTGRLSSERPNGQNIPKSLRPLFKARKGFKYIGYDADMIEAKLIALYTNDSPLYNLISQNISFHDNNVKVYFGYETPVREVKAKHPKEREAVKSVGYSLFYNSGANRVNAVFTRHGYVFGKEVCRGFVENFRNEYHQAFTVAGEIIKYFESGKVFPNLFGRPLIVEQKDKCFMQAFNKCIQSSASDLCLEGSLRALTEMRSKGINAYPVFFVHDFAGFEVEESRAEEANQIMARNLTDFPLACDHGPIKLTIDGGIMDRWSK